MNFVVLNGVFFCQKSVENGVYSTKNGWHCKACCTTTMNKDVYTQLKYTI